MPSLVTDWILPGGPQFLICSIIWPRVLLDVGAEGIVFPRVESPELLAKAMRWVKFPPEGDRGFGLTNAQRQLRESDDAEIAEHVNRNLLVVIQIETQRGVDAREELLSVPGVDALMVGPADLSFSLGVPGDFQHAKMVDAMDKLVETCRQARCGSRYADANPSTGDVLARSWDAIPRLRQRDRDDARKSHRDRFRAVIIGAQARLRAGVAKWQTQQTQNLPRFTPCVGSSPTSGTMLILLFKGLAPRFFPCASDVPVNLPWTRSSTLTVRV